MATPITTPPPSTSAPANTLTCAYCQSPISPTSNSVRFSNISTTRRFCSPHCRGNFHSLLTHHRYRDRYNSKRRKPASRPRPRHISSQSPNEDNSPMPNFDPQIALYYLTSIRESAPSLLTKWEADFLDSIEDLLGSREPLTQNQYETLERIYTERT